MLIRDDSITEAPKRLRYLKDHVSGTVATRRRPRGRFIHGGLLLAALLWVAAEPASGFPHPPAPAGGDGEDCDVLKSCEDRFQQPDLKKGDPARAACDDTKSCKRLVDADKAVETGLGLSVSVGYDGNRAEARDPAHDQNLSSDMGSANDERVVRLSLGFSMDHGVYPQEIRMKAATKFRSENGETSEDVSDVEFGYDRYFRHDVEGFMYAKRYVDSFMSIDQRWEAGFGTKYEWNLPDKELGSRKIEDEHDLLHPLETGLSCKPKQGWYRLTREGYRTLEAWAAQYRDLKNELEAVEKELLFTCCVCSGCTGVPDSSGKPLEDFVQEQREELFEEKRRQDTASKLPISYLDQFASGEPEFVQLEEKIGDQIDANCKPCSGQLGEVMKRLKDRRAELQAELRTFRTDFCDRFKRSLEKRHSRFELAFSVALFAELEKATIEVQGTDAESDPMKFSVPGKDRLRWSLRPSVTYRPLDSLTFKLFYFYMPALDSPARGPDGSKDIREHWRLETSLAATAKISVIFSLDRMTDDVPPFVEVPSAAEGPGMLIFARDQHWISDFKVSIKL